MTYDVFLFFFHQMVEPILAKSGNSHQKDQNIGEGAVFGILPYRDNQKL